MAQASSSSSSSSASKGSSYREGRSGHAATDMSHLPPARDPRGRRDSSSLAAGSGTGGSQGLAVDTSRPRGSLPTGSALTPNPVMPSAADSSHPAAAGLNRPRSGSVGALSKRATVSGGSGASLLAALKKGSNYLCCCCV